MDFTENIVDKKKNPANWRDYSFWEQAPHCFALRVLVKVRFSLSKQPFYHFDECIVQCIRPKRFCYPQIVWFVFHMITDLVKFRKTYTQGCSATITHGSDKSKGQKMYHLPMQYAIAGGKFPSVFLFSQHQPFYHQ